MSSALHLVPEPARGARAGGGPTWAVPAALLILSVIPLVAGSLRLVELAGGPQLIPTNARIAASPTPLVVHVLGAAVYIVLGAFQFPARLRRRRPGWHRTAGRVLVAAGLAVACSGLWMTLFYRGAPGGAVLRTVRLLPLTQGIGEGAFGKGDLSTALSLSAAWIINAAVAAWLIHRRPTRHRRTAAAGGAR